MKAHGIVALRKRLSRRALDTRSGHTHPARGAVIDLPELSPTHQAMLGELTLERLTKRLMTRHEWVKYADYVLEIAKDAQRSLAKYKLAVRDRCKFQLAELHAVHRHMPRHYSPRKAKRQGKHTSKRKHSSS
jgi:hypothetical protein